MPKAKRSSAAESESPVLNLTLDSKSPGAEPVEVAGDAEGAAFQTPCSITGAGAGFSGGMLGYVFGFGGYWMRNRLKGQWKASLAEGWSSAKTFAIMGGLYAAVTCLAKRIRQREDGWNGAAAGCATGLALGWSGGPSGALQSCALFGVFSYFIDGMAGTSPAQAAMTYGGGAHNAPFSSPSYRGVGAGSASGSGALAERASTPAEEAAGSLFVSCTGQVQGDGPQPQQWLEAAVRQLAQHVQQAGRTEQVQRSRQAVRQLLSPAMPLLAALSPCQFGGERQGVAGCRVVRRR